MYNMYNIMVECCAVFSTLEDYDFTFPFHLKATLVSDPGYETFCGRRYVET